MNRREIELHQKRLSETARKLLDAPDDIRINKVKREVWIPYRRAEEILNELEDLITFPKRNRMPGMLLVGHTNNGKTALLTRFIERHSERMDGSRVVIPIIHFSAPQAPSHNVLYEKILDFLNVPYSSNDTASRKEYQVRKILEGTQTRMIIIDEFHEALTGGSREQTRFLGALKGLSNMLKIPIVVAGIEKAHEVVRNNDELANRFEPEELPEWEDNEELAKLLVSFESILPLKKPSGLNNIAMRNIILEKGEGILGEMATIIQRSAIKAIESGKEYIDEDVIASIKYTKPSERNQ